MIIYHLIVAHNGNDTQGLHSIGHRVEPTSCIIAKDNIGVDGGLQVGYSNVVTLQSILEGSVRVTGVSVRSTCSVTAVVAITIDIHIIILTSIQLRMQEDGTRNVTAVNEAGSLRAAICTVGEALGECVFARPVLEGKLVMLYICFIWDIPCVRHKFASDCLGAGMLQHS